MREGKRIKNYIIYCIPLFILVILIWYHIRLSFDPILGNSNDRDTSANNPVSEKRDLIERLRSIGYLTGSAPASPKQNVTKYIKDKTYRGLNLYTSGHGPEAILIDMNGNILHTWHLDIWSIWPDFRPFPGTNLHKYWRRALLMENGDLFAIFTGIGLIKIDKNSKLIWDYPGDAHHDIFVAPDGLIYIVKRIIHIVPEYNPRKPILEDFVCILNSEGQALKCVSIFKAFKNSSYAFFLERAKPWGDIFHTNTIELLDRRLASRSPAFKKGNVLLSILRLDTVCVIDMESEKIVWAVSGPWKEQHEPSILSNGNMLIFDNQGLGKNSRVMEVDPFTLEILWEYKGTKEHPFYSHDCGACARLPNGNTLITESNNGRAFEVTPEKQIVWEFFNPHRAGKKGELIATLFDMVRLRPDFPTDWID